MSYVSKSMSYLLRHGAVREGISIDKEGFIKISDVVSWLKEKYPDLADQMTDETIYNIVTSDTKSRYNISDGKIRAAQGHSIEGILVGLRDFVEPGQLLHGSYQRHKDSIKTQGFTTYVTYTCPYDTVA